jgi:thioredoxin-dependent peroxiredoxin
MSSLQVGDPVPHIAFNISNDQHVSLADFKGQVVVLFFYPADNTLVCTRETCSFRDSYADFKQAGAVVIGVSGDSQSTHGEFAASHQLPYLLVSDADGSLRRAFGVRKKLGFLPDRVTYVIDRQGIVRDVFHSQLLARKHVQNALRVVRELEISQNAHP